MSWSRRSVGTRFVARDAIVENVTIGSELTSVFLDVDVAIAASAILQFQIKQLAQQKSTMIAGPVLDQEIGDRSTSAILERKLKLITCRVDLLPEMIMIV
ncbi:MAG TPA: hypothetical protein EYG03_08115 [Planctomycetes bacterium]|nr:hypothetical protein [Planctomycetota bacterium]